MNKTVTKDFKLAEAMGEIKSAAASTVVQAAPLKSEVVFAKTPSELEMAIANATMGGLDYVEIDEELFNYLVHKDPVAKEKKYLTYHGMKLFLRDHRDQIERENAMSAEAHADMVAKRRGPGFNGH